MVTWFHRGSGFSERHSRGGELRVFSLRDAVQVFAGQWKVGGSIFGTRACVHGGDDGDHHQVMLTMVMMMVVIMAMMVIIMVMMVMVRA